MAGVTLRMIRAALVAASIAACLPAMAQDAPSDAGQDAASERSQARDPQGQRMQRAFSDWATRWSVPDASFVAMRGAKTIGQAEIGKYRVDRAAPIASLSKAITGVCVVKLVEAGKLSYGARLGRLIPDYFKRHRPVDARAKQITLRELLTHTSGMAYDMTQGSADFAALDFRKKNLEEQLAPTLNSSLGGKTYFYNNVNYAALGLIIEAATKTPYESYCKRTVLKPAKASGTAALTPSLKVLSAYGGWRISALDYARFLDHFRRGSKLLKSRPASWPKVDLGGGAFYGPGVLLRKADASYNFWHSGAFSWLEPSRPASFGSYFAMWSENTRFVAMYEPRLSDQAVNDLDYSLYQAAFPSSAGAAAARASEH